MKKEFDSVWGFEMVRSMGGSSANGWEASLFFDVFILLYPVFEESTERERKGRERWDVMYQQKVRCFSVEREKGRGNWRDKEEKRGVSTLSSLGVPVLLTCRRTKVSCGPLVVSGHLFFILVRDFWILLLPLARFVQFLKRRCF